MSKAIKQFIHSVSHKPFFWPFLYVFSILFKFESFKERLIKIKAERGFFKRTGKNTTIVRGPFAGMLYPRFKASYSEMAPKILGSYEAELFGSLNEIFKKKYDHVLDIGCAEGYYAVGLALRMPNSDVYAYDINHEALRMCDEMARLNGVSARIHLRKECSNNTLKNFDFGKKSLIVCDCEGYELQLFTKDNIENLTNCDLLIELHDILGIRVKEILLPVFQHTHNIQLISSKDRDPDLYPELEGMNHKEKKVVLSECRDGLFGTKRMEWAYITPKHS